MKILVFGKTGQVGSHLGRHPNVISVGRAEADLGNPAHCAAIIEKTDAQAVINAAAYTAVDKAEEEPDLAYLINAAAPAAMALAAAKKGVPMVHISTDYVFDGSGDQPRMPTDEVNPLGVYGSTKLAGENAIRDAGGVYAILRTSWVFSAVGNNFVKTMLRLSETRSELGVVHDQIGAPTSATSIADACIEIAKKLARVDASSGIYHFAGTPDVSWAGFAKTIFEKVGKDVRINAIPTSDYPTPAKRPLNSRLDCNGLLKEFGIQRPSWQSDLDDVLTELGERK